MPGDRPWAYSVSAAAATALTIALDRGRAIGPGLLSLVRTSASNIGDPWPSVVAARRLTERWGAPIYGDFSDVGSSFIYPPLAALPYTPFARMSYEGAHAGIAATSRLAYVAILALALALAWDPARRARAVLFAGLSGLGFYPLLRAVELNQATLFAAVALGASMLLARRGSDAWAGAACALAAAFKPQLALVVPLVLFRSRRFATAGAAALGALGLASVAWGGATNHLRYASAVLPRLSGGYAFYPNQSWSATLLRLDGAPPWDFALHQPSAWVRVLSFALGIATLAVAVATLRAAARHAKGDDTLALTIGLAWLFVTLASPISWEHHFVPALFVFAIGFRRAMAGALAGAPRALLAASFPLVAGYLDVRGWDGGLAGRLAMSYLFAGALALAAGLSLELTATSRGTS